MTKFEFNKFCVVFVFQIFVTDAMSSISSSSTGMTLCLHRLNVRRRFLMQRAPTSSSGQSSSLLTDPSIAQDNDNHPESNCSSSIQNEDRMQLSISRKDDDIHLEIDSNKADDCSSVNQSQTNNEEGDASQQSDAQIDDTNARTSSCVQDQPKNLNFEK